MRISWRYIGFLGIRFRVVMASLTKIWVLLVVTEINVQKPTDSKNILDTFWQESDHVNGQPVATSNNRVVKKNQRKFRSKLSRKTPGRTNFLLRGVDRMLKDVDIMTTKKEIKCGNFLVSGVLQVVLMEEILHQLIGSLPLFTWFYTSLVVQDFFHQQWDVFLFH